MAIPRDVTSIIQSNAPSNVLVQLGQDIYFFDSSTSKYVRIETSSSTLETNVLLNEMLVIGRELIEHLRLINEADLGE